MKISALPRPSRSASPGFSLVEVVLAVGIMALGVVTIIGLLPHGMDISRQTADELAITRIFDGIVSEAQALDWESLNQAADEATFTERYFDDQGLQLTPVQVQSEEERGILQSYIAQVEIPPLDVYLPIDASGTVSANNNIRRLIIRVAATPRDKVDNFDWENPPGAVTVRTFTQLVGRMR